MPNLGKKSNTKSDKPRMSLDSKSSKDKLCIPKPKKHLSIKGKRTKIIDDTDEPIEGLTVDGQPVDEIPPKPYQAYTSGLVHTEFKDFLTSQPLQQDDSVETSSVFIKTYTGTYIGSVVNRTGLFVHKGGRIV